MKSVATDNGFGRRAAARLALLLSFALPALSSAQDPWRYRDVGRVVAVADIHGAYDAFEKILRQAAVVDAELDWIGQESHLVIVGDVVDRGADSRRALDLIRKLETEAMAAGGRVHLVLGNHEIMNMTGDLRYVSSGEYAAFAGDETDDQREAAFERFLAESPASDSREARVAFEAEYPRGFFAHREAFSLAGEYGSWLHDKPVVLVINETAFVHGGLVDAMSDELNRQITAELTRHLEAVATLVAAGLLSPSASLGQLPELAAEILAEGELQGRDFDSSHEAAARQLRNLEFASYLAADGPVWYRGNVACNRLTESDRLAAALESIGARRIVIGHTPARDAYVRSRLGGTVLRVDTGMLSEYYGGRASALIIEDGALSVIYEDAVGPSVPVVSLRQVGGRPGGTTDDELEIVLANGELGEREAFDATAAIVSIGPVGGTQGSDAVMLPALFTSAPRDGVNVAVAAYRLDRLLGLDMVPVTVAREVAGIPGALQYWPEDAIGEPERMARALGSSAWCPLPDQFDNMYVFDTLIFNEYRTPDRIRYDVSNFQLLLLGHDRTFGTDRDRPEHLQDVALNLTRAWREALAALDEETLTAALGDVLDRRRIRAILSRRDRLLEDAR